MVCLRLSCKSEYDDNAEILSGNTIVKYKPVIRVMSRFEAFNYCKNQHSEQAVIISISTPHIDYECRVFKSDTNGIIDILELFFADVDDPGNIEISDDYAATKELLTDKDAKRIAEFAERYKDKLLIIHCDEGVSRSAGVAAAILRHYTGDDAEIFDNLYSYNPNMWCYFKVLKAFGEQI